MTQPPVFAGLTVIELAGVLAGPSAGLFFSELGATVIKVENPRTNGDVTRSWKVPGESGDASAYYWSVNAGKETCFIDLTSVEGRAQLHALIRQADIVITNYSQHTDTKLGADYTTLKRINPSLIYAAIQGFADDPARTAYDLILQAESGFMSMNGEDASQNLKMPVALIDIIAGHQLKEAILIALLKRKDSGMGCKVTVTLFKSAVASLANQATNWLVAGHLPVPSGSLHPNIAPYGEVFVTSDKRKITFAIGDNRQFAALCALLSVESVSQDQRFTDNPSRVKHRRELSPLLASAVAAMDSGQLAEGCHARLIPYGFIRNIREVFELPAAQQMVRVHTHNGEPVRTVSSIAFQISDE